MLIDDGISGLWEVRDMDMAAILQSTQFKSLYQVHYFMLAVYWKVFGSNAYAYFFWFIGMQAFLATLIYKVLPRLAALFQIKDTELLFFVLGLLFMSSPHNIENFAWAATSHYALAFIFYFVLLQLLLKALHSEKERLIAYYFLFVLSLFTMEVSLLFPISVSCIVLLDFIQSRDVKRSKRLLIRYILPLFLGVFLAFSLLYVLNDTWIPRGNADFISLQFRQAIINFWNYILQALGYTHYLNTQQRFDFYRVVDAYSFWPGLLLIAGLIFFYIKRKKYFQLLILFHIALFIAPNLFRWGAMLFRYENVRFLYFALPFMLLAALLFCFRRKFIFLFVSIALLITNLFFLNITLNDKQDAGLVHETFLQEFEAYKDKDVYLLNIPNCCAGYQIFRGYNRIRIASDVKHNRQATEKLKEILWYCGVSVKDSFSVEKVEGQKLNIRPKSLGVWLMADWGGAVPYEDDEVQVEITEWSGYFVRFKKDLLPTDHVLLFSDGRFKDVSHLLR